MTMVIQIVLGILVGTSLMTLFSYFMTYEMKEQFKEPQLLNELLNRSELFAVEDSRIGGWVIHYGMGTVFVTLYHFIWQHYQIDPSLLNGSIFGFVSGFIGIAGWVLVFRSHHNPPAVELSDYFVHLIAAHIIFGIGAAVGYGIASENFALY